MASDGRAIPYLVAGNGGYFNLSPVRTGRNGALPKIGVAGTDGKGNKVTLEAYNDQVYGFLRLTVNSSSISCEAQGVNESTDALSTIDSFTLDLQKHVVSGGVSLKKRAKKKKPTPASRKNVSSAPPSRSRPRPRRNKRK
jgi:hypothetical protein